MVGSLSSKHVEEERFGEGSPGDNVPTQVKAVRPEDNVLNFGVRPYSRIIVICTVPILLQRYKFLPNRGESIGHLLIVC